MIDLSDIEYMDSVYSVRFGRVAVRNKPHISNHIEIRCSEGEQHFIMKNGFEYDGDHNPSVFHTRNEMIEYFSNL